MDVCDVEFSNEGPGGTSWNRLKLQHISLASGKRVVRFKLEKTQPDIIFNISTAREVAFSILKLQASTLTRAELWTLIEELMAFRSELKEAGDASAI